LDWGTRAISLKEEESLEMGGLAPAGPPLNGKREVSSLSAGIYFTERATDKCANAFIAASFINIHTCVCGNI
jgi:hypothetical protein